MKNLPICISLLLASAAASVANPVHTRVLAVSDTLTINVGEHRVLEILNFVHEGSGPGTVALVEGAQPSTIIMTSVTSSQPENRKVFFVSGKATVTVTATTSPLTISYQEDSNTTD
jgi:hypothetical protein